MVPFLPTHTEREREASRLNMTSRLNQAMRGKRDGEKKRKRGEIENKEERRPRGRGLKRGNKKNA